MCHILSLLSNNNLLFSSLVLFPMLTQNTRLSYYRKDNHFLGLVLLKSIPEQAVRMIFLWMHKSQQLTGLESFWCSPCPSIQHNSSFVSICQCSLCTYCPRITLPANLFKSSQLLINHFVSLFVLHVQEGNQAVCTERKWLNLCKRCCCLVLSQRFELMGAGPWICLTCLSVPAYAFWEGTGLPDIRLLSGTLHVRGKTRNPGRDCSEAVLMENIRETAIKSSRCI